MKKYLMIIVLFHVLWYNTFGQDSGYQALVDAFKSSYTYEYQGDYTGAINALKEVYDEQSYEINLRLGWLHYLAGLFTESLSYYNRAIQLKPYAIEPKLGYNYPAAALGNWDQVINQYQAILKIDPQNTIAHYRLGNIYYGKEDYQTALEHFSKVVNLYPFDYDGLIMYAWTNYKLGKTKEAKVLFQKVLLINPEDSSALEGLSLLK